MSSNLIVPVPRQTVQEWINRLNGYIRTANEVSEQSTFTQLRYAEVTLHRARELHAVLFQMGSLSNWQAVEEDLNRIDAKIFDIRTEKSRKAPKWKS